MTVKIEAEGSTYEECLSRLGVEKKSAASIEIDFRREDYGFGESHGAVVRARGREPREFDTMQAASDYLNQLLEERAQYVNSVKKDA